MLHQKVGFNFSMRKRISTLLRVSGDANETCARYYSWGGDVSKTFTNIHHSDIVK